MSNLKSDDATPARDAGFGLIEIVVSMFMLGLLCISFLPLLISGIQTSARNATLATATQLANQELELAAATAMSTPNCQAVLAFANASLPSIGTLTDRNSKVLQPHRELVAVPSKTDSFGCPLTYPGNVKFHSWVTESGSTTKIVEATTFIYVKTAS